MSASDPVEFLFGGMEKLGPGGDEHTLHALRLLPKREFRKVVDAGCGAGRQTFVLAKALGAVIDAVDSHQPFLDRLTRRAAQAGLGGLVRTHCMDMQNIPDMFPGIDLIWSEGAAYNIGFANALAIWREAVVPGGFVVVSELSWLGERRPRTTTEFFLSAYPDMKALQDNIAIAESAGYEMLGSHVLPATAWTEGYYDVLGPRAAALVDHSNPAVSAFARETLREIEIFRTSDGSYGYAFLILRRV